MFFSRVPGEFKIERKNMRQTRLAGTLILAVVAAFTPAPAQTVSDLLQKAIYAQETVGDLESAIQLYKQIIDTAKDMRSYGAQAQYRLGLCLLKKGNQIEAMNAFKAVIEQYPEEKELVAKAREHVSSGLDLLPAPWAEGEILEYRMKLAGGMTAATMVYSVDRGAADTWQLKTCTYMGTGVSWSRVEARRDNMRPIESWMHNWMLGTAHAAYQGSQVVLELKGKPASTVTLDGPTYDNEEFYHLIRRLPLTPAYKTAISVISSLGGVAVNVTLQVTALEDVETPAGKFQAYKVELSTMRQIFWVANEPRRLLVKFEGPAFTTELVSIRNRDNLTPLTYSDPSGYSVALPAGWLTQPAPAPSKETVFLLDPEMTANVIVWAGQKSADKAALESNLRSAAETVIENRVKGMPDFKVRPDSWQTRQINGRPALSLIADFTMLNRKQVEYITWVRNESLITQFRIMSDPGDFEAVRNRMDPILETVRLK